MVNRRSFLKGILTAASAAFLWKRREPETWPPAEPYEGPFVALDDPQFTKAGRTVFLRSEWNTDGTVCFHIHAPRYFNDAHHG